MSRLSRWEWACKDSFPRVSGDEPGTYHGTLLTDSFPRVSGDEPDATKAVAHTTKFSPHERG